CAMLEMLCVSVLFSAGLLAFTVANVESIVEKFRSCATKLLPRVLFRYGEGYAHKIVSQQEL
ncbi:MAG: hypothetical protein QW478_11910, partial [Candidatus Micrarchaeaceae archaeon]